MGKKFLAVIPARGGSKGVSKKNIKLLNGKPLIQYTIDAARAIFNDKDIYLSTDSEEIKLVSEKSGIKVPFLRPKELATDTSSSRDVLLHALEFYKKINGNDPDVLILLQPTSPFRTSSHIEEALKLWNENIDMVVSVKQTDSNPYYVLFEENSNGYLNKSKEGNFIRRQDCPRVWEFNGAIYLINPESLRLMDVSKFKKVVKFEMDEKSSFDIDTLWDWSLAEFIIQSKLLVE